jgi:hypothetical protein
MADEAVSTVTAERKPAPRTDTAPVAPDPRDEQLRQANERIAAAEKKYADDMGQISAALQDPETIKALAARVGGGGKPPDGAPEEGDDSALIDRKELKRHFEDLKKNLAGVLVETTGQSSKQIRQAQKEILRPKLPHFARFEKEIDGLLDKVDPRQAASPETIQNVYNLVVSQHQTELLAEREAEIRKQIEDEFRERGWTRDEINEEAAERAEAEFEPGLSGAPSKAPARPGAAPSGDASVTRSNNRTREAAAQWRDRDEKTAAGLFGITSPEEFRRYSDPKWRPDIYGFAGKERI